MIRTLPRGCWAALTLALAVALFAPACRPSGDARGVPLYPNSGTTRRLRGHVAQVMGPIATIDGRDLLGQGGWFELLPGCHVVELDSRVAADGYALSGGVYLSGQFASTTYAMRMKAGARYVIRRDLSEGIGQTIRATLSAREEQADGTATDLVPAKSAEDIKACRDWASTALGR
jgi:hypothetical protein